MALPSSQSFDNRRASTGPSCALRALPNNHRAATMAKSLKIGFDSASKTARRVNNRTVTGAKCRNALSPQTCGVNRMTAFKGIRVHAVSIAIKPQK